MKFPKSKILLQKAKNNKQNLIKFKIYFLKINKLVLIFNHTINIKLKNLLNLLLTKFN